MSKFSFYQMSKLVIDTSHGYSQYRLHMLAFLFLACIDRYDRTSVPIWNYTAGTLTPVKRPRTLLNRIALSNSSTGKCAPMQAVKQYVREL